MKPRVFIEKRQQAEAEVVPSSSLFEVEFEVEVEVAVDVVIEVEVGVEVGFEVGAWVKMKFSLLTFSGVRLGWGEVGWLEESDIKLISTQVVVEV